MTSADPTASRGRPLVAGVDSSTQSCKVVIRDAETGRLLRTGAAAHPAGTSVHPAAWGRAFDQAVAVAGGLADVAAISIAGQQHGMVCLDDAGEVVRNALLWNDTRSAKAADDLVAELPGGAQAWARATGSVPLASFTVAKLRWLAEHEPQHAARTAAVALPHDWLTWRVLGRPGLDALVTDRGDASGTGYWSPFTENYRRDLLELALGASPLLPSVLSPAARAGQTPDGIVVGAGTGDNAAAALGVDAGPGDVVVSIGTSGVVDAVSETPTSDSSALVAGFADATGHYLPLACTLNAARVLEAAATLLGVSLARLSELALGAPPGAEGLVLVPFLDGERTPNRPNATGALHGIRIDNATPANLARAAVEGMLCGLADGLDALRDQGIVARRALLVGGGAQSRAVRELAPAILGLPVTVPEPGEYVADGAARQAAWALGGERPSWQTAVTRVYEADPLPDVRARYAAARELTTTRPGT